MKNFRLVLAIVAVMFVVTGCEMSELAAVKQVEDAGASDVDESTDLPAAATPTPVEVPKAATVVDEDLDGDHYTGAMDCDESNPKINHYAEEICDGIDNNCDGKTDEDVTEDLYLDADKDGFGSDAEAIQICKGKGIPNGYVQESGDCNDSTKIKDGMVSGYFVNPDEEEICDGIDNNCDGQVDEGCIAKIDPVPTPDPVTPSVEVSDEFSVIVAYPDAATRTMSAQEYYSELEIGKWWTTESMEFHSDVVSIGVSSKDACGVRFNISTGKPEESSLCDLNLSPNLDESVVIYKVTKISPKSSLWIDVTDKVTTWNALDGKGCSAQLKLKDTCK